MLKFVPIFLRFCTVAVAAFLISCGGGDSQSGVVILSDEDRDPNLPPYQEGDICIVNNISISPSRGSTLKTGDVVTVLMDFVITRNVIENLRFDVHLVSTKDDHYFLDWEKAHFEVAGEKGRLVQQFRFVINAEELIEKEKDNHYEALEVLQYPVSGCNFKYPIEFGVE